MFSCVTLKLKRSDSSRDSALELSQAADLWPGVDMDQQAGGIMGGRGPGETASELLARRLDKRLADLKKALQRVQLAGEAQRSGRTQCKRIALVGYTNAGKTTLMNNLASTDLVAKDMPFVTLDTTVRALPHTTWRRHSTQRYRWIHPPDAEAIARQLRDHTGRAARSNFDCTGGGCIRSRMGDAFGNNAPNARLIGSGDNSQILRVHESRSPGGASDGRCDEEDRTRL